MDNVDPKRRKYVPTVVEDFDALDADIDAYIGEFGRADSTRDGDRAAWKYWVRHCEDLGYDPESAPFFAWEALWACQRQDGFPLATQSVLSIVKGVVYRYLQEGWPIPIDEPEHRATWKERRLAHAANEAARLASREQERHEVVPLLRDDLRQLAATRPRQTAYDRTFGAAALLALDLRWSATRVSGLGVQDVVLRHYGIEVCGQRVPCDHRERVRGVPWDCTACAVRAVIAEHPGDDDRLLAQGPRDLSGAFTPVRRRMPGLVAPPVPARPSNLVSLVARADLTMWQLAGLRRALVLNVGTSQGLRWVRARVWVVTSWCCGFRMCSDLRPLARGAVDRAPGGEGYRLRLLGTKDDPLAYKGVVRALPWSTGSEPSPASVMAEYLCVRDALLGSGARGALLAPTKGSNALYQSGSLSFRSVVKVAQQDLDLLCRLADVPRHYSTYSIRKGYAAQGLADGWTLEQTQEGLRHLSPETTLAHYVPELGTQQVQRKFMDRLS